MNRQKLVNNYLKLRKTFYFVVNLFFLNPINLEILKRISLYGYGTNRCLKKGFLPVPVHYYSPVPDIQDLKKRKVWDKKNELKGINFDSKKQLKLLSVLGDKFGKECRWALNPAKSTEYFYVDNSVFSFGCASVLYTMIRKFKPKRIIEIGSGQSSKIISQAITVNKDKCRYTIIDPYPGKYVRNRKIKFHRLIKKRVELVNPAVFDELGKGDILFIDSSHSVKIGSDVNFLYLDVLPRLKLGVIVHVHDISLPYEYSKTYATNEFFRQFWIEQYLLQGFLTGNRDYQVLLGMAYIMKDHLPSFKRAFKHYQPEIHKLTSGSFWIQRK